MSPLYPPWMTVDFCHVLCKKTVLSDLIKNRGLFVQFFFRAYVNRTAPSKSKSSLAHNLEQSGEAAIKGVERKISEAIVAEEKNDEIEIPPEVSAKFEQAKTKVKETVGESLDVANGKVENVREWIEERTEHVEANESTIEREIRQAIDETDGPNDDTSKADAATREVNGTEEPEEVIEGDEAEQEPQPEVEHPPHHDESTAADEEVLHSDHDESTTADEEGAHSDHDQDHDRQHEADGMNESGYEINESAYEANFDELKSQAEKRAEAEMQPNGTSA